MAALCRRLTEDLLLEYINPLIEEMNMVQQTIEIDPAKIDPEEARNNIGVIVQYVTKVFDKVTEMSKSFPKELTYIFTCVRKAVEDKYGAEEALKIVGAFIFLRLINPVLLTPAKFSSKCLLMISSHVLTL